MKKLRICIIGLGSQNVNYHIEDNWEKDIYLLDGFKNKRENIDFEVTKIKRNLNSSFLNGLIKQHEIRLNYIVEVKQHQKYNHEEYDAYLIYSTAPSFDLDLNVSDSSKEICVRCF